MTAEEPRTAPYAQAHVYHLRGWTGPIPLPPRGKAPPPPGWTGYAGAWPSGADIQAWRDDAAHAQANLALRLPPTVLGIDVDCYDTKPGAVTLADAQTRWGVLPDTYVSTSRDDGSGIRFYTVPAGRAWADVVGPGAEVIHWGHRYAVVWPSWHPEGRRYRWLCPDGSTAKLCPRTDDLPALPPRWVDALDRGPVGDRIERQRVTSAQVAALLVGLPDGPECPVIADRTDKAIVDLGRGVSRHDTTRGHMLAILGYANDGHHGGREALDRLRAAFLAATTADPNRPPDDSEWRRMLDGATALLTPVAGADRRCCASLDSLRAVAPPAPMTLDQARAVFRRWLGDGYDLQALDAVLATAAVHRLGGDPTWLLVVSGSGNAKTETVSALAGAGAIVTSTITSEGALLSATSRRDRGPDATGGLLRRLGEHGLMVVKDFTSILAMNRDMRAMVLAALREIHDGRWERNVGTDGGRTLTWTGRLVLIGAVTTAYDAAHAVIAAMGDRFALVRVDSGTGRIAAGRQALSNIDQESQMRAELAAAAGGVLAGLRAELATLAVDDTETLLAVADLVTLARTAVERDYRGDVIDSHAPEMPTRFAKMLGQIVRGALALGMNRDRALGMAVRVARDSMPPLRLAVLTDVAAHPASRTGDVRRRLQRPYNTVDRELQALHTIGLLVQIESEGKGWRYHTSDAVNLDTLRALVSRNVSNQAHPSP